LKLSIFKLASAKIGAYVFFAREFRALRAGFTLVRSAQASSTCHWHVM